MTNGESVCGIPEYSSQNKNEPQICSFTDYGNNVIAEGGHAYVNGNKGGFKYIVTEDGVRVTGGAGGFGGGGQGKYI